MAAQDAELKLKVSLDLGFFRQQLTGLGQAAAGYSMPVQVKFDRRAVQNELNALSANIRKRDYRLTIQTNLKQEIEAAKKLAQAFSELERGAFISAPQKKGSFTQKSFLSIPSADIKKLYKEAANAGLLSYDETIANNKNKIAKALSGLGKDSIAGLLNGLNSENEKLKAAATNLGKNLIASVKAVLGIASPSKEFKKIGEDSGEGFEQGLKSGLGEATRMGIKEMRELFRALQGEAQSGAARLQATMLAAMAGIVQLPGGRQQRGRLAQSASAINTAMTGAAAVNIGARQSGVRRQAAGAASATPAFMTALPMMFGMSERELMSRLQGLYGQQYRAPSIGGTRTGITSQLSSLISSISGTRGPLGTGGGAIEQLFRGGAVNPGVLSSGYIGRSALSPKFVNYPAGMHPAYATGFIEPTAFGSLAAGTTGRYGMGGAAAFPSSPMMRGGIGAGGGSFIPMQEVAASSNRAKEAISGFTARLKNLADFVAGNQSLPISPAQQRQAAAWANSTRQGNLGSRFVGPSGNVQSYAGNFPVSGMVGPSSPIGSMGRFPMAGMMYPSSPLGVITAQSSMFGGGGGNVPPSGGGGGFGGMGGFGGFGRAIGGINLPGSGIIRELGSEFAFATKQVLLFGQAYKMLAFIQDFPAQVGAAVSQLQNFRNTLGAISPTAEEAASSNQLILDLVERYNVPLQSARDGFTKLYASMAPAGFSGDEIRDLFTGITQAAATFGMSADKVDRVNYAFAQMASKGQVMSEELKGQLGDVLPGAMALFAEAAGFEGPKAIQDFSQALEDGAYKGEAMVALLKNVGVVMNQEFGPGAEGAARTFQGVINRMQNSMTLLYESFEPVAVGFLNGVVVPLTSGIKQISDGFNAFFTGATAQTTGGFGIAQELERLRPAFEGIAQNIAGLVEQFGQFAGVALEVGKVLLQIAGNPIVGYLARLYAIALPINIALNVMRGLWAANALQLLIFNARVATGTSTLSAFRGMMAATGATAQTTAASIRTAGITLRTFFATTGVGLVIVGISMLIEKFMSMNQALADTKAKALGAAQAIRSMSETEARTEGQRISRNIRDLQTLQKSGQTFRLGGQDVISVPEDMAKRLQEGGVGVRRDLLGRAFVPKTGITAEILRQQDLQREAEKRQEVLRFEGQQMQQQAVLAPIPPSEGDGKKKKGKELDVYNRSQLNFIQKQFELEKQSLDKRLQGELISQTQYDIALAELKLETEKLRIAEEYRLAIDKTNADNLSASDKALKLKDLEIIKNKELAIAEDDRNIAIGAARKKIIDPILDEIDNETLAIERQTMEAKNLAEGRLNLSAAQEAELSVKERYASLSQDERENAKGELDILRQIREQRLRNAEALRLQLSLQEKINETRGIGGGLRAGFFGQAAGVFERSMLESDGNVDYATQMANIETAAMQLRSVFEGLQSAIGGVSEAFANVLTEGVTNMITGTATAKEVFASFLQSVGQALSQAASQMIATYIAIGIAKMFAGLGGGGNPAGSGGGISDSLPGLRQYSMEGPLTGTIGFTGANGGIVQGGFQAFANGGVVSGPTLGLIGEGKYNEAVVPLPNGKSIPVQFSGERSARDMMSRNAQAAAQASPINLSFETTKIGNTEYVSRDQLEAAMAETRRAAINGGAARGMSMTLDRIQQSPSVRSRIGIR